MKVLAVSLAMQIVTEPIKFRVTSFVASCRLDNTAQKLHYKLQQNYQVMHGL